MSLNFTINRKESSLVVVLIGRLLTESDTLKIADKIDAQLDETIDLIIMDLTALDHCNSSGLGFIIRTLTRARINNTEFVIAGLQGAVAKLFEISKIDNIITVYNNQEEAYLHFNRIQ